MEWHFSPYPILLLFVSGILIYFAIIPWQRREIPGGRSLASFMMAIAIWVIASAFQNAVIGLHAKTFWSQVSYFGVVGTPVLLFNFIQDFIRKKNWNRRGKWLLMWVIPIITLLLVWTNPWHHLIWTEILPLSHRPFIQFKHGSWFWLFLIYSYLIVFVTIAFLIQNIFQNRNVFRKQAIALLVGILIPWIANIVYIFELNFLPGLDLTPLGFTAVGAVLSWCFYGLKMFDLAPIARTNVTELMDDCLIVIDEKERICDLNQAGRKLIGQIYPAGQNYLLGVDKSAALASWPELLEFLNTGKTNHTLITNASLYPVTSYDVRVSILEDHRGKVMGRVLLLHDITSLKAAEDQALRSRDIAEALVATGISLNSALEWEQVLNRILDQISRVLSFDYGSFQVIKENDLEVVAVKGFNQTEEILGTKFPITTHSPNRQAIQNRQTVRIGDINRFGHLVLQQYAGDICSYMAVPIVAKDKVIGILALYSVEADHFTDEDERISESFAGQVAIALDNARIFQQITEMATIDTLTRLYNRRQFFSLAELEMERSIRYGTPLSVLVIDLDHFKLVNDTHGHSAGDQTLRSIARLCLLVLRKVDLVGRLGGEEFGVMLPETSLEDAMIAAERLRETIASCIIEFKGEEISVTSSIGAAQILGTGDTIEAILDRADIALYQAKESGRNKVCAYQASETFPNQSLMNE